MIKTVNKGWLILLLVSLVFTSCISDSSDLNEDSLRTILEEVCTASGFECSFRILEQSSLDYQFSAHVFATLENASSQSIEGVYDNFIHPLDRHLIATGYEEWGYRLLGHLTNGSDRRELIHRAHRQMG